ncbi:ankyrin repeat-containing domain protein [Cladorrhinum sp. PSN332]|nr:ankyrin repeat-containing domain protein [Cladorrhinum sp. PSN332]
MALVLRRPNSTSQGSKAEDRLKDAIRQFEKDLSLEQQKIFQDYKLQTQNSPPSAIAVTQLAAQIDQEVSRKPGLRGRCFGPRFINFLQSIQQFISIGDVLVGGSQNLIACGVWSLVRFSLLLVTNFTSCLEKMSKLLMDVGRSAPRYQEMALLYPESHNLQSSACEYLLVMVRLCHQLVNFTKQNFFRQLWTFLNDQDMRSYQEDFERWATCIREEVNLAMNQSINKQTSSLQTFLALDKTRVERQKAKERGKTRIRVLNHLSAYDFQTSWKEIRKAGNTNLIQHIPEYRTWKASNESCTLICQGKLGSGKSVLLANIIDDLICDVASAKLPVVYFFCRYNTHESLKATTIIRSLLRQLLDSVQDLTSAGKILDISTTFDLENPEMEQIIRKALPSNFEAYAVLDGLDECNSWETQALCRQLRILQGMLRLHLCVSLRLDADNTHETHMEQLTGRHTFIIPEDNPDIANFIEDELVRRLDPKRLAGRLTVGDPALILEISQALLQFAQGMFLWVVLQIESICQEQTDDAIRQALATLPKDLPETFSRILERSAVAGQEYQTQILKLILASRRPLSTEELREALSVVPGNDVWNPSKALNNVYSALASCGGLITVDEESLTVRLVHFSIAQFLLGEFRGSAGSLISQGEADRFLGDIIVTYLSYGVFESQLSTIARIQVGSAPSRIVQSLNTSRSIQKLAIKLLQSNRGHNVDISKVVTEQLNPQAPTVCSFLPYAKENWLHHCGQIIDDDRGVLKLLIRVAQRHIRDGGEQLLSWAMQHGQESIFQLSLGHLKKLQLTKLILSVINSQKERELSRLFGEGVGLGWASNAKRAGLLQQFLFDTEDTDAIRFILLSSTGVDTHLEKTPTEPLSHVVNRDMEMRRSYICSIMAAEARPHDQDTEWHFNSGLAAILGYEVLIPEMLVRDVPGVPDGEAQTTLLSNALHDNLALVFQLLLESRISTEAWDNLLLVAAEKRSIIMVDALCRMGVDIDAQVFAAIDQGKYRKVEALLQTGAYIEAKTAHGETPLLVAIQYGWTDIVSLLIRLGANIEARSTSGETSAHFAIRRGKIEILKTLLDAKANLEAQSRSGDTPLLTAIHQYRPDCLGALIKAGADIEVKSASGNTPLLLSTRYGSIDLVRTLLLAGANMEALDSTHRETPLVLAARQGEMAVVEALLRAGADTEAEGWNRAGGKLLCEAAQHGWSNQAHLLLSAGVDTETRDASGETPFLISALYGRLPVMKMLLKRANKEARDAQGNTALSNAVRGSTNDTDRLNSVQLLMEHGAQCLLEKKNFAGVTPLLQAVFGGNFKVTECLVFHGADMNARNSAGRTPLMLASTAGGRADIVRLLLEYAADLELRDYEKGWTPLFFAAAGGNRNIVNLLLRAGAERTAVDMESRKPEDLARELGHDDVVQELFEPDPQRSSLVQKSSN